MTTIAWDGITLAVDSRVTLGSDIYCDNTSKLYKNVGPFAAVAYSGIPDRAIAYILSTLSTLGKPEDLWGTTENDDFGIVGVTREGVGWFINGDNTYTLPTPWAYGSGGDFAIAAMDHGHPAEAAVKYAATRDTKTNSKVRKYIHKVKTT